MSARYLFNPAVDGAGLPDTFQVFTLAEDWRLQIAGEPCLDPTVPPRLSLALFEQGYFDMTVGPRLVDAWTRRRPAEKLGWRVWYAARNGYAFPIAGWTREQWEDLPADGVLAVVVDVPGASYATLRQRALSAGHGRLLLQSRDPFWWDDAVGHPRDATWGLPSGVPPLAKTGAYASNRVMGAVRMAAIASLNWQAEASDWLAW